MGLDMYFNRIKRIKKELLQNRENWNYDEDIGYLRKANAIHKWIVDNCQNGKDDQRKYELTKEKLQELNNNCKTIIENAELIDGKIRNGQTYKDGKFVDNYIEGKYIKNQNMCRELLPTAEGYFFGSTDYDEYYLKDLKQAVEIIDNILETTDFDKQMIVYSSWW